MTIEVICSVGIAAGTRC